MTRRVQWCFSEVLDVGDELFGQFVLVGCWLDIPPVQPLDVAAVKSGRHGLDFGKKRLEVFNERTFQNPGMQCRLVGRVGKDVPGAKDKIIEGRQRDKIPDAWVAIFGALAQPDAGHLGQ